MQENRSVSLLIDEEVREELLLDDELVSFELLY
jgi:hypothetical protein